MRTYRSWIGLLLLWLCPTSFAQAQDTESYTVALRGVALGEALEYVARTTGLAIAYDPEIVADRRAFCVADARPAEDVLRCVLGGTTLDFYRLSSGTYVLAPKAEIQAAYGNLTGIVIDAETGRPLDGAHVLLTDSGIGAVTNATGRFTFPPLLAGRYPMRISHLSYSAWQDTLSVTPGERTQAQALLHNQIIITAPVIVDGLQARLPSVGLATQTLGKAETTRPNPLSGLNTLQGVRVSEVTADVYVQGGDAGSHQVRLDGVPVFLPRRPIGFIGPFSSFALERITVHGAGFDAAQGSQTSGVINLSQVLEARTTLNAQADPTSVNGQVHLRSDGTDMPRFTLTASGRYGLWDYYRPKRLQSTLNRWSAPDAFLLFAPLAQYQNANPNFFREVLDLNPEPEPTLGFSDVHGAARLRLDPLHTLYASVYQGKTRILGELEPADLTSDLRPEFTSALLSVADDYATTSRAGQVRYDAVLGGRTLLSAQLRGSTYGMDQKYVLFDGLGFGGRFGEDTDEFNRVSYLSSNEVTDSNKAEEWGLQTTLDYATGRHHLRVGTEALLTRSRFDLLMAGNVQAQVQRGILTRFSRDGWRIRHEAQGERWAAFAHDVFQLGSKMHLDAGMRLTYVSGRGDVFAEPRLALRLDGETASGGTWATRTAAGVYRQFVNQMDLSILNAGALMPSTRIWLPVDGTVRPPLALHLAQETSWRPNAQVAIGVKAYYKHLPHDLTLNYTLDSKTIETLQQQADFLLPANGYAYGGTVSSVWTHRMWRANARYTHSVARQRSEALFDGRTETTPWNEPHRLDLALDWKPRTDFTLSARWQGVWGRAWGFRRAYYDYFAHIPGTRIHAPFDLSQPSDHTLPALHQLDLSAAYARALGPTDVQIRMDVLNVLDRQNVAYYRLVFEDDVLQQVPQHLYPLMPNLAVRVRW